MPRPIHDGRSRGWIRTPTLVERAPQPMGVELRNGKRAVTAVRAPDSTDAPVPGPRHGGLPHLIDGRQPTAVRGVRRAISVSHEVGQDELWLALLLQPGILAGFAASSRAIGRLDEGHTRPAVLTVAAVMAIVVILRALW